MASSGDTHDPKGAFSEEEARRAISELALTQSPGDTSDDAVEDDAQLFPPLTAHEVKCCAFSSWYPEFSKLTFKSEIIHPLEQSFIDYLLSDGLYVPEQSKMEYHGELEDFGSSDGSDWEEQENEVEEVDLADISKEIEQHIAKLGGAVFPRMAWSAPTDASWVTTTGTLKCTLPTDIFWLLKSSDKISHDLSHESYPISGPLQAEPELVLRQWANLYPSMMFRCFVRDHKLIAISQVDVQFHKFLEEMKLEIESKIEAFFNQHISKFPLASFCFDAYVARTVDRVMVVDFEPWSHVVDSCLYEWRELIRADEFLGLRLFPEGVNPIGHFTSKYSTNRFPIEVTADAYHNSIASLIEKMQHETT
ncbi:hypothetical protein LPJ78_003006 [Coemansia sp. RSA 989]|nr:D123-domain-containing protein [Coemansia mojavensis]KAJ1742156.1 hypothetical protein LPJ68_002198 [Coemansia sp. RSA 1086]KAJ1750363.1 hypothetical protein LPJ79_002941 [Coemansia sp. RSA 1821]KAJ1864957.1 hypothetical protein LPJ78_003006 [Coemansia sp. RSA 989]KAJ1872392.1 hypothetical protein LPJ55_003161 [Coemansia sp. RSA 990]KAJ2671687.1 hypothetical protein IWW42_003298 [Coemansia sp. RSA 1085]